MAVKHRCIICHKVLRPDGYCGNTDCIDYIRTRIHDKAEAERQRKKREEMQENEYKESP